MIGAAIATGLAGVVWSVGPAAAQSNVVDVFKGKNLTIIIPGAGGDRQRTAGVFIAHFGKHVPGNPTVVPSFMPGAGGTIGLNYLYNVAPRDGTYLASPLTGFVLAQATGEKSVKYDVGKMSWIGRTGSNSQILYAWHTTGVTTLEGAKSKQILIGSTGPNSASTVLPLMLNDVLGTRFKIIEGYNSSAAFNLAVERGETDGAMTTWGNVRASHFDWVKDGRARLLVQLALVRHPDLPEIPTAIELASDPEAKALLEFACSTAEVGQSFVTGPGVPAGVVEALRKAFEATIKDPEYLAAAQKAQIDLDPMSGEELAKLAARTLGAPKSVIARYQAAVAPK